MRFDVVAHLGERPAHRGEVVGKDVFLPFGHVARELRAVRHAVEVALSGAVGADALDDAVVYL